jgi:heme/copper-type cytochrome/quinol oxidase subunit 2
MTSIKNIKGIHTISKIKEKIKYQRDPALIKELHLTLRFIRAFDYSGIIFAIVIILSMISLFSVKQSTVNVNDDDKSSSENIEVPLYYYPCAIGGSLVVMFFFLWRFSFYNRLKKPKKQQQNSSRINSGQNISV